jgi:hypothetical protein
MQVPSRLRLPTRATARLGAAIATSTLVVAGSLAVAASSSAQAAPAPVDRTAKVSKINTYGSIQIARNGAWGKSRGYRTIKGAKRRAHRECRQVTRRPCYDMGWVRNACMAVAVRRGPNGLIVRAKTNSDPRRTKRGAYRQALRNCRRDGGRCKRLRGAWTCSF